MDEIVEIEFGSEAFDYIADAFQRATKNPRKIRLCGLAGESNWLKVKVGEGMWSPALYTKSE